MRYLNKIIFLLVASLFLLCVALIVDLSVDDSPKGIVFEKPVYNNRQISRFNGLPRGGAVSSVYPILEIDNLNTNSNYVLQHKTVSASSPAPGLSNREVNAYKKSVFGGNVSGVGLVSSDIYNSSGSNSAYIVGYGRTYSKGRKNTDYSGYLTALGVRVSYQVPVADIKVDRKSLVAAPAPNDKFISPYSGFTPMAAAFNSPLLSIADVNSGLTNGAGTDAGGDTQQDIFYDEVTGGVTVPLGDAVLPMLLMAVTYLLAFAFRRLR